MTVHETEVLIIGGGATGTGLARDLALRGVSCILVEQQDINAGASGANHGLLHSGARYVYGDPESARECYEEAALLKQLTPGCIEDTGGLFVAVAGDDEAYAARFPGLCEKCGIPVTQISPQEARALEPALSDRVIAAYLVDDAAIDPFKLSLENMSQARNLGAELFTFCRVTGFEMDQNRICATHLQNSATGREFMIRAGQVVNAAGAWAGKVAALAGATLEILFSKGSLLVTHNRLARRVINRLRPSANADILVPGGTVSILGTTSVRIDDPDDVYPTVAETDAMIDEAAAMIPALENTRYIRAYAGVRPLVSSGGGGDDRKVSRGFALLEHEQEGLENFITISGGKLTTYRLMAERTADLVCRRLGVTSPCRTRTEPLPSTRPACWTEPGRAPKTWLKGHAVDDLLLCECEMVSKSVVDEIADDIRGQNGSPDLNRVGLRSRIGKGACQGTFCGPRISAYLFDKGGLTADQAFAGLPDFLQRRWKGNRPILWDRQMVQAELLEAMHCGLLGLELEG